MILNLIDEAVAAGARQSRACGLIGIDARTLQRWRANGIGDDRRAGPRKEPSNKLSKKERAKLLKTVNSSEYRDLSPKQIVPRLADEGQYLASESTIYRVLREEGQMAHRGTSRPPTERAKPAEHVATGPGQVWSWDITYLRSPVRGSFFYLDLVVDIWSRKIVGWAVHENESAEHSAVLIEQACTREQIRSDHLVLHSDNGGPMKGATMLATLQDLGIAPSFSRPRVSDDNPYSEALFRTVKYRPEYPNRPFASVEDARLWVERFVAWYNTEHRHSAISFVTPEQRHSRRDNEILAQRHEVYEAARAKRPDRWTGEIRDWTPVKTVVLNPDANTPAEEAA